MQKNLNPIINAFHNSHIVKFLLKKKKVICKLKINIHLRVLSSFYLFNNR